MAAGKTIYEKYIRAFSKEGTFSRFESHQESTLGYEHGLPVRKVEDWSDCVI